MALIEDLIAAAGNTGAAVREIVTGPDWIMVTAAGSGVAARIFPAHGDAAGRKPCEPSTSDTTAAVAGKYLNRPLDDLLGLASSSDPLKASLGVAALNSAFSAGAPAARPRSSGIPRAGGKTVATIGEFAFIEDLKRIADRVITLDAGRNGPGPDAGSGGIAPGQAPDEVQAGDQALATADIAIIRGSTLITGTLESWLARTRHCYTVVYGPSTPLSPLLFEYGANQLVGINVRIADVAAGWIREGGNDLLACPGVKPVVIGRDQG